VPMVQRKYDFFINHCQTSGQDQCNTLSLLLKQKGAKVWCARRATAARCDAQCDAAAATVSTLAPWWAAAAVR
jgi:hypothetical protein